MRLTVLAISVVISGLGLGLWQAPAWACGGLFCSSVSTVPAPVDQNAERIIFEVGDDTITAHIEIQFVGTAQDFAWVVPIGSLAGDTPTVADEEPEPSTEPLWDNPPPRDAPDPWLHPSLAVAQDITELRRIFSEHGPIGPLVDVQESDAAWFDWLDASTRLQILLPAGEPCAGASSSSGTSSFGGGGGGGCGSSYAAMESSGSEPSWEYDSPTQAGPVTVYGHGRTDHYEFHVIGSEKTTADLVTWLQDNDYNVSDNMTPVMDVYNAPGALFLALKLRRDASAQEIAPIALTYRGRHPSIPIRLTAVAAQPLMGIQVFILGERPYISANYESRRPDAEALLFDSQGRTSYFDWVARVVDEAGGSLLVTEFVDAYYRDGLGNMTFVTQGDLDRCDQYGAEWSDLCEARQAGYVSRYYTRLNPHQMVLDPVFVPAQSASLRVSKWVDLSSRPAPVRCGEVIPEREPAGCAFNYCGRDAECGEDGEELGCLCAAGTVAQGFNGPDGIRRVTCVPTESVYAVTPDVFGPGTVFDPCESQGCGEGTCVLRGGFPSCACEEDAIAVLDENGRTRCVPIERGLTTYGPGAGLESAPVTTGVTTESLQRGGGDVDWALILAIAALGVGVARRRVA